jgi:hypothetical protein
MKITRLYGNDVTGVDLTPYAVLEMSIIELKKHTAIEFERDDDDLGPYDAAFFKMGNAVVALIHYSGEPANTVSVFIPRNLPQKEATKLVCRFMKQMDLSKERVSWPHELTAHA